MYIVPLLSQPLKSIQRTGLSGCSSGGAQTQRPLAGPFVFSVLVFPLDYLDFDIHAGGQVHVAQGFDDLLARVQDVQEALVHAQFELLPGILVDKCRAVDGVLLHLRRQRDRADDRGVVLLRRLDDLAHGVVDQLVVVSAHPEAELLRHILFFLFSHWLGILPDARRGMRSALS